MRKRLPYTPGVSLSPPDRNAGKPGENPVEPTGRKPVTLRTIRGMVRRGEKFSCLTAYDATMARWLERGGVDVIIVGDSAAQVVLGLPRTVDMPLDLAIAMCAAVKRGAPNTLVMGDMPFATYHESDEQAVRNAARFMREGLADVVKIEADASFASTVTRLARAGIPVCAHVGCRPQTVALTGGYKIPGRTAEEAEQVVADALALERAGAVMLLVEGVPDEVTKAITASTNVPLIGIGAGTACHGQVLVIQDLLGLTDDPPRFAEAVVDLGRQIAAATAEWGRRVRSGNIGGERYVMREGEAARFGIRRPSPPESADAATGTGPMGTTGKPAGE